MNYALFRQCGTRSSNLDLLRRGHAGSKSVHANYTTMANALISLELSL